MKLQTGLVALSLSFASNAYSDGQASIGFNINMDISGLFSPIVEGVQVTSIENNSPADKAGLQVGDRIVAIDNIQVPGCLTKEAKQQLRRLPGEALPLIIERENGIQMHKTVLL